MTTHPLPDAMLADRPLKRKAKYFHSACWRGYVGNWEIVGERLFLTGMQMIAFEEMPFGAIFPEADKEGIFAFWFTGELVSTHGKVLRMDPVRQEPVYERTLVIGVENGIVRSVEDLLNE